MKKIRECFWVLIAAFLYGIMPVIIKNAYNYGANGFNVTFYMALISIPVYLGIILFCKYPLRMTGGKMGRCVIAGIADMGTFLLLYISYSYISVGVATMLNFIYPITVALAMHFLFREKFSAIQIGALFLYLGGMGALYGGDVSGDWRGFVLALLSGLSYTVHAVYLDKSGLSRENVYTVGLYKAIVAAAVSGIAGVIMEVPMQIKGWEAWGSIVLCMILCRIISGALMMIGIRALGAFIPSVLSTVEPVVALLAGVLILNEDVTAIQLAGTALILAAVLMIILNGGRNKEKRIRDIGRKV